MNTPGGVILFFSEATKFNLRDRNQIRAWLKRVATRHKRKIITLNYIFVSDAYLLKMNQTYLNHPTYTDIITFDSSAGNLLSGEMYISIDRVRENAKQFEGSMRDELHRVMAHGLLHLCGFADKSPQQAKRMRNEEEKALALRRF